jgi:putative hydrolase of the HAD superfamily
MTQLDSHIDQLISCHQYGVSKESQSLWQQLQQDIGFDNNHTLFVDDSKPVLESAKKFGIQHLLAVANPDSKRQAKIIEGYTNTTDFRHLLADIK